MQNSVRVIQLLQAEQMIVSKYAKSCLDGTSVLCPISHTTVGSTIVQVRGADRHLENSTHFLY